jgi:hypothetical protein
MNRWLAFLVVLNCSIAISVESSLAGAVPAELYNKTGLGQWSTRFYSSIEQIGAPDQYFGPTSCEKPWPAR